MTRKTAPLHLFLARGLLVAALAGFLPAHAVALASAPQQVLLLALADNAMALTHRLLNESSAAKSVIASDNARAKALREEALALYEQALEADRAGDTKARDAALRKAKMNLFKAAQLAKAAPDKDDHDHDMFRRRLQSAEALLEAHRRIRQEGEGNGEAESLEKKAITDIEAARTAFEKEDVQSANRLVNRALGQLKASLIRLRNGTTLVRSLNFETPKDEYEYELDRNQSHTLLSGMLLQNRKLSAFAQERFDKEMDLARRLRKQAEEQAARGEYEAAIESLEESTSHIVRAIRAAGIYIPG